MAYGRTMQKIIRNMLILSLSKSKSVPNREVSLEIGTALQDSQERVGPPLVCT